MLMIIHLALDKLMVCRRFMELSDKVYIKYITSLDYLSLDTNQLEDSFCPMTYLYQLLYIIFKIN